MTLIAPSDILDLVAYEKVRDARRREVIALKRDRRVQVGRYPSFVFENRLTVWFQIQEMVLDRLLGIDTRGYVRLSVGPHVSVGVFESGRSDEEAGQLSAVHFVRFPVSQDARILRDAEVTLRVDHPNERARDARAGDQSQPRPGSRVTWPRRRLAAAGVVLCVALGGCGEPAKDPVAERGRQVYLAQCTSCHAMDPAQAGAVGPPVKGSSKELLEARVLRGTYPPGYTPKRPSTVMPPQPHLANDVPALAAYLQ